MARFADPGAAERGLQRLGADGYAPVGPPIVSRPDGHSRFRRRRGWWALAGALAGAVVGAVAAGLGVGLGGGFLAEGAEPPLVLGAAIGAALAGTLGLLAGLALGEPRATRETTEAIRAGDASGEVAVRFEVPPAGRDALERRLREAGAIDVGTASRTAPAR